MKQNLAGLIFERKLAEVNTIGPPRAACLLAAIVGKSKLFGPTHAAWNIAQGITPAGGHQPAIGKVFGALIAQAHKQLIALLLKIRAQRETVNEAHSKKPIIPLPQRQLKTAGSVAVLADHGLLRFLRTSKDGNEVHPTPLHPQTVLANLGRKHCQVRLSLHVTASDAFHDSRRKEYPIGDVTAADRKST